jgi:ribosomal protein L32|uniref:Large ribosomal subunit protein bL32c n=3 Tax=unclassified Chloroparvula TaxID=2565278 RepID=A0A4D6C2M2_9CHLO|nr:ribosomal protein L32 [Chloroparvula sp. RCC696]QBX97930.1 ribosomal protein L32 [Chloroparvula sp. RCC999]QBX98347.1 ribosomal protein L32 [Chloroparvula sp. RCC4572]
MAVPKKRCSKTRKRTRRAVWKAKCRQEASKAFNLAKAMLSQNPPNFVIPDSSE